MCIRDRSYPSKLNTHTLHDISKIIFKKSPLPLQLPSKFIDISFTILKCRHINMTLFSRYFFTKFKYFTLVKTQNNAGKLPLPIKLSSPKSITRK